MQFPVIQHNRSKEFYRKDSVVTESPLRLVLIHTVRDTQQKVDLGITLCSPDDPCDLIRGWLYHHQLLEPKEDCQIHLPDNHSGMVVTATLQKDLTNSLNKISHIGLRSSSCGYCGDLNPVTGNSVAPLSLDNTVEIDKRVLFDLDKAVLEQQDCFQSTGSIHAAAAFNLSGTLLDVREDIGRHNALDKLTGSLIEKRQDLHNSVLWLSSRMSFEMAHKASVAGYPIVVSVGGPSSMAIQLCHHQRITLVGFCRENRYNLYTYPERIKS